MRHRAQRAAVGLVKHFGLVGRHIDTTRAVRGTCFAAEAQVKAFAHLRRGEATDEAAIDRVLQHARTPARHVLLIAGRLIARAHEAGARADRVGPALAHARAAVNGLGEVAVIMSEGMADARAARGAWAAQVGVKRSGIHHHARVHHAVGVKEGFHLAEQRDRLGAVHRRQQFGAGTPITVLTAE